MACFPKIMMIPDVVSTSVDRAISGLQSDIQSDLRTRRRGQPGSVLPFRAESLSTDAKVSDQTCVFALSMFRSSVAPTSAGVHARCMQVTGLPALVPRRHSPAWLRPGQL